MKANFTHIVVVRIVLFILLLLYSLLVFAQPDYNFTTGNLIAGVDRQVNAQYRYNNVRAGVDAKVTIVAFTGGITLSAFDGGSGYAESLQPNIDVPANSSGYAEFRVDFYVTGTNLGTLMIQTEVPITPIDVDGMVSGPGRVNEFDQVYMPNGYYMFDGLGNELAISRPFNGWWVQGTNTGSVDYPGIDTSVKRVMFSVMNASISSITFRVGATNTTGSSANRLRSVYFKKFNYPNPVLPLSDLKLFTGTNRNNTISLNWELTESNSTSHIELERSADGNLFYSEAVFLVTPGVHKFNYTDNNVNGQFYYRLKLTSDRDFISQSNIITFKPGIVLTNDLKAYPTITSSSFTASIRSERAEPAMLELIDLTGRMMLQRPISLQSGLNSVQVYDLEKLNAGHYIVVVRKSSGNYQTRIVKK